MRLTLSLRMGASECFRGFLRCCSTAMLLSPPGGTTPDGPASEEAAAAERLALLAAAAAAAPDESTCVESPEGCLAAWSARPPGATAAKSIR